MKIIVIFLSLFTLPYCYAQIYTIDYLTLTDQSEGLGTQDDGVLKLYLNLFKGKSEFDDNGHFENSNVDYSEFYFALARGFRSKSKIQVFAALQVSGIISEHMVAGGWGTPWIWAKIQPFSKSKTYLRLAYKIGWLGYNTWTKFNQFDIGLLSTKSFRNMSFSGAVSYRINFRNVGGQSDFGILFDQFGNAIHYKFEPTVKLSKKFGFSLNVLGYFGGDKKYKGIPLPDSKSSKTALGGGFIFHKSMKTTWVCKILSDYYGRNDKKGLSIVFELIK